MHTLESENMIARIKWIRHQLRHPQDHVQFRAAVFGRFEQVEDNESLNQDGYTTTHASSYAKQWEQDLKFVLGDKFTGFADPLLYKKLQSAGGHGEYKWLSNL